MTFMKWQKYCGLHNYIMSRFTKTFLLSKKVPDDEGDETKRACLKKLGTNKVPSTQLAGICLVAKKPA